MSAQQLAAKHPGRGPHGADKDKIPHLGAIVARDIAAPPVIPTQHQELISWVNEIAELTQPDSVAKYLQQGKEAWINDSYWLVMPFKLKDSGVTLKYLGEAPTQAGQPADVLQLTFEGVGVTPQNKYKVWVDKETKLVSQWAHFRNASDPEPAFVMPWQDYQTYGGIKLSGDRGQSKLTDIKVLEEVPEAAFTSFEPVEL